MGKRALKMRIKPVWAGTQMESYAVQQRFRVHHTMSWKTLDVFNTLEECVQEYPYRGVILSAQKLGLSPEKSNA